MRKMMTKKQRAKRVNDIKILVYYSVAKIAQFMSIACVFVYLISCAADIEYNSISNIMINFTVSLLAIPVLNSIAHKLTYYLYKKHAISKSKVIRSIITK